jgi:hypothetical protein
MIARARALALRAVTSDPAALADHLGVRIVFRPLPLWLPEMYLPSHGIALINARMTAGRRRWYICHSLGHAVLHAGDQRFLLAHCLGVVPRQESQAERFAAFSLAPELTPEALAELPPDKRLYRVQLEAICAARAA